MRGFYFLDPSGGLGIQLLRPPLLKGSWDLVTRVINKLTLLITVLAKSPEPPSRL